MALVGGKLIKFRIFVQAHVILCTNACSDTVLA